MEREKLITRRIFGGLLRPCMATESSNGVLRSQAEAWHRVRSGLTMALFGVSRHERFRCMTFPAEGQLNQLRLSGSFVLPVWLCFTNFKKGHVIIRQSPLARVGFLEAKDKRGSGGGRGGTTSSTGALRHTSSDPTAAHPWPGGHPNPMISFCPDRATIWGVWLPICWVRVTSGPKGSHYHGIYPLLFPLYTNHVFSAYFVADQQTDEKPIEAIHKTPNCTHELVNIAN